MIVGGGLPASDAPRPSVATGYDAPIRMVCAEPHRPYDRPPLSKQLLAGALRLIHAGVQTGGVVSARRRSSCCSAGARPSSLPAERRVGPVGWQRASLRPAADRHREPSPRACGCWPGTRTSGPADARRLPGAAGGGGCRAAAGRGRRRVHRARSRSDDARTRRRGDDHRSGRGPAGRCAGAEARALVHAAARGAGRPCR